MQPASINLATPTLSRTNSGPSSGRSRGTMRRTFNPANSSSMAAKGQGEFGWCPCCPDCGVISGPLTIIGVIGAIVLAIGGALGFGISRLVGGLKNIKNPFK